MTRKSMTLGAIFVLFAVPAQVTPASAVPEDVRTACLFEAYEVRPRLNAPDPLSSPGGSHVSLLRYVQFPVQSAKFPVSILREFGERFEFDGFADDCLSFCRLMAFL